MDLKVIAKRYEEGRRFWAHEMSLKMANIYYDGLVGTLRILAASTEPQPAETLYARHLGDDGGLRYATHHTIQKHLTMSVRYGLVKRMKYRRAYWYVLTELGALALEYLGEPTEGLITPLSSDKEANPSVEPRKRPRGWPRGKLRGPRQGVST